MMNYPIRRSELSSIELSELAHIAMTIDASVDSLIMLMNRYLIEERRADLYELCPNLSEAIQRIEVDRRPLNRAKRRADRRKGNRR